MLECLGPRVSGFRAKALSSFLCFGFGLGALWKSNSRSTNPPASPQKMDVVTPKHPKTLKLQTLRPENPETLSPRNLETPKSLNPKALKPQNPETPKP